MIERRSKGQKGFSLVEVVIAIGIVAFCLVLLVGLIPAGLKTNKISSEEFRAMNLMTALIADVQGTPQGETKSKLYGITPLPFSDQAKENEQTLFYITDPGVTVGTGDIKDARFKVTWTYTRIPDKDALDPVEVWIKISWPVLAPEGKTEGFVETYAAFRKP